MSFSNNKAFEGDVVEMLVDVCPSGERGQQGVVITVFDNPEAYDLEVYDEKGDFVGLAYSVQPHQFSNLSRNAFIGAMTAVEHADLVTAERQLRLATSLRPDYIGAFVMSILRTVPDPVEAKGFGEEVSFLIPLLRLAVRVDPGYEFARINLAVAFLNFGVAKARQKNYEAATELFYSALGIKVDPETEMTIRTNLVRALTSRAKDLFEQGAVEQGFVLVRSAFHIVQDDITRRNLGLAYGNLGVFYMRKKIFDFALEQFERAEDSGVILSEFVNDRGVCLVCLNKIVEAKEMFERVLHFDPQNEQARFNLDRLRQSSFSLDTQLFTNQFLVPTEELSFDASPLTWRTHELTVQELALA